jgi:hypothetical protein
MLKLFRMADLCEKCFVPFGIEPPLHRRRVIGFEPQMNLQDSLRATIGWYRAQGWL